MINKIDRAKSRLMLENPYFGSLVTSLKLKVNNNIASTRVLGDVMEYNSEYLDLLSIDEVTTILANSSMHQALFHTQRGSSKISSIWRLASDYAINDLLIDNGFTLPPLANYSSRFKKFYAEQIYTILLSEEDIQEEDNESKTKDENREIIPHDEYELLLEELNIKLKNQGELPKGIEQFVELNINSKIAWRDELYRYVNSHIKSDYRMFPPNKRHLYRGVALPSIYGEELKIIVAIDTSASINQPLLEQFLSELYEIMQIFNNYIIELIESDAKIHNIRRVTPLEPLETSLKGGGGTDFRPVFDYVETLNEEFKFLIYFSDGMGSFPKYQPTIDTLWVIPKDNSEIDIPFGEVLHLD